MTTISMKHMNALKRITYARSYDKSKPTLNGLALEPAGLGKVYAAATNGFLLAWALLDLDEPSTMLAKRLIIPGRLVDQIEKLSFRKKDASWLEITDDLAVLHRVGLPSSAMRWAEGNFPSWWKAVPTVETIKAPCTGRWSAGMVEQASKALGADGGFLVNAVSCGLIHTAHHDGVFVLAVQMSESTNREDQLLRAVGEALRAASGRWSTV